MAAKISSGELVAAAMKALDVTTETDLRDALRTRYGVKPAQSQINRWANGEAQPSFSYTIVLLDAAGWLNQGRVEAGLAAAARAAKQAGRAARNLGERESHPRARRKPA